MASNYITGLDVGTASIKTVVAENHGGKAAIKFVSKEPSVGLRRGAIVDLAEASQSINKTVAEIKKISKQAVKNIYLNIGTPQIKMQPSRGIVAVSRADSEIYQGDMERAVKASEAINLPPNRTVIHNITREYIVDGVGDIMDPLGLAGSRLEVQSLIIDAFSPHVKSLMRAVELAGGEVGGLVFGPLVASRSTLSKSQMDLGTVLVDIGFGTTGMSVYEESKLSSVAKFPLGAGNISNDIAVGLKIPVPAAEALKLNFGYAMSREIGHKESIDLKKFHPEAKGAVSRRFLSEIIESRLVEIFEFVNNELKLLESHGRLPGGVVLVGGGAKLPGIVELVKQELKLACQIGLPLHEGLETDGAFAESMEDPEFVTAAGLVMWGGENEGWQKRPTFSGLSFRNAINYFLP